MLDTSLSDISGYISIVFWLVVFLPQLHENYQRQNGDGLSLTFLIIWLVGDIFNLVGVILENLMFTMFLLALWYTIADICLIWQVIYYQHRIPVIKSGEEEDDEAVVLLSPLPGSNTEVIERRESLTKVDTNTMEGQQHQQTNTLLKYDEIDKNDLVWMNMIGGLILILLVILSCYGYYSNDSSSSMRKKMKLVPQILGWSSAILYVGSRLPQIIKNWRQKSTDGLSPGMFICAVLGNLFFALSIFLRSTEKAYLLVNLSWIIGSLATVLFDMVIFLQFYAFDRRTIKKST